MIVADIVSSSGNQLFSYAATKSIAFDLGYEYRYRVEIPYCATKIDIMHPEKAIHIIESCIKESKYEHAEQKIKEARMDVLNRYNLFAMICAHVNNNQLSFDRPKKIVKIQPASVFRPKPTFARRILRKIVRTWRC